MSLNRGVLLFRRERTDTVTYQFRNKSEESKTLVLEHPRVDNRKLKDSVPAETTADFYRFEVPLAPSEEREFPVTEIIEQETTIAIQGIDREQLGVYLSGVQVPAQQRAQLEQVIGARERLSELESRRADLEGSVEAIFTDQNRLRQNLQALRNSAEEIRLRERYLGQLNEQEDQLGRVNVERAALEEEIRAQEARLAELISELSFTVQF